MRENVSFIPKAGLNIKYSIDPRWRPFEEARKFARALNFKSIDDWFNFTRGNIPHLKKPDDIPATPFKIYKFHGWCGWVDWLGFTPGFNKKYLNFRQARYWIRKLQLQDIKEWKLYCRNQLPLKGIKPRHIPGSPNIVYKGKWISWPDWLGNGIVEYRGKAYEPFIDARQFARSLKLQNVRQWYEFCRGELAAGELPETIPAFPNEVYLKYGWRNWPDWLGLRHETCICENPRSFVQAREYAKSLCLKSQTEWVAFCKGKLPGKGKRPADISTNPSHVYRHEWQGWGDFLGTGTIATFRRKYRPFNKAREFARSLGLKNWEEWREFVAGKFADKGTRPPDIPSNPDKTYKKHWKGSGDWLGTGKIANRNIKFKPFEKARAFVQALGLKNQKEWNAYRRGDIPGKGKRPADIPSNPDSTYKDEWKGWGDWLGNGNIHNKDIKFLSFFEAKDLVKPLKLKNMNQWRLYYEANFSQDINTPRIPLHPERNYKSNWISWDDFLGNS